MVPLIPLNLSSGYLPREGKAGTFCHCSPLMYKKALGVEKVLGP